jgi:hypothetical protein
VEQCPEAIASLRETWGGVEEEPPVDGGTIQAPSSGRFAQLPSMSPPGGIGHHEISTDSGEEVHGTQQRSTAEEGKRAKKLKRGGENGSIRQKTQ